jgi:carboxypeptidase family protein
MRGVSLVVVVFICGVALLAAPLSAQTITGTIQGTVVDASRAVLPVVTIKIKNLGTNQVRKTTTNETGNYVVSLLPVGSYEVSSKLTGFKTQVKTGLELRAEIFPTRRFPAFSRN